MPTRRDGLPAIGMRTVWLSTTAQFLTRRKVVWLEYSALSGIHLVPDTGRAPQWKPLSRTLYTDLYCFYQNYGLSKTSVKKTMSAMSTMSACKLEH